jgi:transposase
VNHAPAGPAVFAAGNPMRLPYDAPAQPPLHAWGLGVCNYNWRLRSSTGMHKPEIAELCHRGPGPVGQVAKDADVTDAAALAWADQAGQGTRAIDNGGLASADLRELAELRRETRRLREDVEILKRIAAIFAAATRWA